MMVMYIIIQAPDVSIHIFSYDCKNATCVDIADCNLELSVTEFF